MKTLLAFAFALACATLSPATNLTLKDGREFVDARIGENSDSERVVIMHRDGIATVPIALVPAGVVLTKPRSHRVTQQAETEEGCEIEYDSFKKLIGVNYRKLKGSSAAGIVSGALQAEFREADKTTGRFIAIYVDIPRDGSVLGLNEAYDWLGNRFDVQEVVVHGNAGEWRRETGYISVSKELLEKAAITGGSIKFCGKNGSAILSFDSGATHGFLFRCSREFPSGD